MRLLLVAAIRHGDRSTGRKEGGRPEQDINTLDEVKIAKVWFEGFQRYKHNAYTKFVGPATRIKFQVLT